MATVVQVDFGDLLAELEAEKELQQQLREHERELDRSSRAVMTVLNKVHSTPSEQVHTLVEQTVPHFARSRSAIRALVELVPENQYYKWCECWSFGLQKAAYVAALTFYLVTGRLISKGQATRVLGIRPEESNKFQLSTEEYLHSLVSVINELSRLAINSVTLGDFGTPLRLSAFVKDIHAGFQLLNLKNDSLRKRFDSIKYDVKKIEEVVYDISLRGLTKPGEAGKGIGVEADDDAVRAVLQLLSGTK